MRYRREAKLSNHVILLLYVISLLYLLVHFLVYLLFLRRSNQFYGETSIFLYHLCSICLYSFVVLIFSVLYLKHDYLITLVGLMAAHGIYSLSFLELWSLAQGSYSISILTNIQLHHISNKEKLINDFSVLGDEKIRQRLQSLQKVKLITHTNQTYKLTPYGRVVVRLLHMFLLIPNIQNNG